MKQILFVLVLCLLASTVSASKQDPIEGYAKTFFSKQAIGANATASILLTQPVSRWSMWLDQSASFTFQSGAGVGFKAASATDWKLFTGSTSLQLIPQHLPANTYLWIKNGATASTIRIYTFGQ
jgi:hypothetical protein